MNLDVAFKSPLVFISLYRLIRNVKMYFSIYSSAVPYQGKNLSKQKT